MWITRWRPWASTKDCSLPAGEAVSGCLSSCINPHFPPCCGDNCCTVAMRNKLPWNQQYCEGNSDLRAVLNNQCTQSDRQQQLNDATDFRHSMFRDASLTISALLKIARSMPESINMSDQHCLIVFWPTHHNRQHM